MNATPHLTRAVIRAIIANRPYVVADCRRRALARTSKTSYSHNWATQKRTIFGFLTGASERRGFEGAKSTPKNIELALGKLVDLVRATRSQSRTPTEEELLDAFKFVFLARLESAQPLTRNEVYLATETFNYLKERELGFDSPDGRSLSRSDLQIILSALTLSSAKERYRSDASALASMVMATIPESLAEWKQVLSPLYIIVLARSGSVTKAHELARMSSTKDEKAWVEILKGFINEGRLQEFDVTYEEFKKEFGYLTPEVQEDLATFFAERDDIFNAQRLFEEPLVNEATPSTECIRQLLEMCIRNGKRNWGQMLANQLVRKAAEQNAIGTLLLWNAVQSTDSQSLKQTAADLLQGGQEDVSMETFNRVIEYALHQNNPQLASELRSIAKSWGLRPDGKTRVLQLEYALDMDDLERAKQEYEALLMEDVPSDGSDLPIFNKYITKLAFSPSYDYELLMRLVDTIIERNGDLSSEAVAGLCHVFLTRDEIDEAGGLLRYRIDSMPTADRAKISTIFRQFITNTQIVDQRAFNAYELFRYAFPETPVSERLPIMQSFFDRKRPDFACLVFGHMRQREDPHDPARPTAIAYAQCFEGIAQCRDVDGLQMISNMLKLDLNVERNTMIRNSLMLANIACQMPYQAILDHFYKIMDSREGPSYSTFEIALRACESWVPYGSFEARKIIAVVQSWNLEITKELYDCYVGAIAGQSEFEDAVELVDSMKNDIGEHPDAVTIGILYNAMPWQFRKDEVEKWAKQAYPDLWEELVSFGDIIDEEWEVRYFKLNRSFDINDPPLFSHGEWKPEISRQQQAQIEPLRLKT